jgi:DNA-binding CsgD family transcriptional regulator
MASPELLAASPYFQEYVRPQKHADIAQIHIMRSATRLSGLGFGRHESVGVFSEREVDLLRLFVPHVRRAVAICNGFGVQAIESARLAEALDALPQGVILVREDGHIIHANLTAESMMRDGGPLGSNGGVLHARDSNASAQIRTALRVAGREEVGMGQTGLTVRLNSPGGSSNLLHVLPLAGSGLRSQLDSSAIAAVIVHQTVEDAVTAKSIARAFGLTPAETRTLIQILEGKSVPEAAEQLGVSPTTARTHLDSIFAKTGVSRQSHLVRLATRMAPGSA